MNNYLCPFCEIAAHRLSAAIVYEDDELIAFKDAHPIAPVHLLIVPRTHIPSINEVQPADNAVLGRMSLIAQKLAQEAGISKSGYRLVINTGRDAGQTIFHLHMHLIGGRHLPFRFE